MTLKINISDSVYRALIAGGEKRMRGSIGLISPTEATFNAWNVQQDPEPRKYMKLPHGRVSMTHDRVRLTLAFDRDESSPLPLHHGMQAEALLGAQFVEAVSGVRLN